MQKQKFSGFDVLLILFQILADRKKIILFITGTGTIVTIITVLLMEETYRSSAIIKPPVSENMGSSLSSFLKDAGALAGLMGSFLSTESEEDDCLSILGSVRFTQLMVDRFNLIDKYEFSSKKKYHMADVYKRFNRNRDFEVNDENAIKITMEDSSAREATEMVAYMIKILDSLYIDMQKNMVKQKLDYFNSRVEIAEQDMKFYEDSLMRYQKIHNIFMPEVQVEFNLEHVGKLEMQIELIDQQMDLEAILRGKGTPKYKKLKLQKRRLKQALHKRFAGTIDSTSLLVPINTVPSLVLEYFRLERMYRIKLTVYKLLIQNVELLKLENGKNIKVVSVIDPPWINTKKIAPRRRLIVQMVFVLLIIASSLLTVALHLWEKHKAENSDTYRRVKDIWKALLTFK